MPPGNPSVASSFRAMVRDARRQARDGRGLVLVTLYDGQLVGQVTLTGLTRGSAQWVQVGYWIDRDLAGRGITTTAVALVVDHCLQDLDLHRVEIAIRPENTASLRVVDKLGFRREGLAPRYLHIDGAWRDHLLCALTVEELPTGGLTGRLARPIAVPSVSPPPPTSPPPAAPTSPPASPAPAATTSGERDPSRHPTAGAG